MLLSSKLLSVITLAIGLAVVSQVQAGGPAVPPSVTSISVDGMHCAVCAKKMTDKLALVKGVANAQGDVPSSTVTVIPQPGISPSPRAMWEAIEQAGYKPLKLVGPAGSFVAKPQS